MDIKLAIIRKTLIAFLGILSVPITYAGGISLDKDVLQNEHVDITVCAVPQLYDALAEVKVKYEGNANEHHTNLNFVFSPASLVYTQIQNKEITCDMFLGNDMRYPGLLIKSEVAYADSLQHFIKAQLILWSITSIVDSSCKVLLDNTYNRISLPDPKTQASGYAAFTALQSFGLNPKLFRSKLMYGANEYQTLSFIINGNVIMGILPKHMLVGNAFAHSGSYCTIPDNYYEPLYYYSVILKTDKYESSRTFAAYLLTEVAQNIFKKYGFK